MFEQNVGRFDVSMNEPLRMSGFQAAGKLQTDPQDVDHLQRTIAVDPLLQ